jgi:hypothetical protein
MSIAERRSYGLRTEDGYGCILLQPGEPWDDQEMSAFDLVEEKPKLEKGGNWGPPVRRIALDLQRNRIRESAAALGLSLADQPIHHQRLKELPNHLVSRMLRLTRDLDIEELAWMLEESDSPKTSELRQTARRKLRRFNVSLSGQSTWKKVFDLNDDEMRLDAFLRLSAKEWGKTFAWITGSIEELRFSSLFGKDPMVEEAKVNPKFAQEMVKHFLASFLRTISLRKRKEGAQ